MASQWIEHPVRLNGKTVELLPLEQEHLEALYLAASDMSLWEFIPTDCSEKKRFDEAYSKALQDRARGVQYPFVIFHLANREIIGSTRLFEIFPSDLKLEIGWTWIQRKYWGSVVNLECKQLLLTYCFESLGARRVQLKTKDTNIRSRRAIEKIGGKFEGILRKDRIQQDGSSRNAAYFSILDDEWEMVKKNLLVAITKKYED